MQKVLRRMTVLILAALGWMNPARAYPDTPLEHAAWDGNVEETKKLLAAGANPNGDKPSDRPPLYCALAQGQTNNIEVARLLIAAGADVNAMVDDGYGHDCGDTLLMAASRTGKIELMKMLMAAGAKVDAVNKRGEQPIHLAAAWVSVDALKVLIDAGAKINARIKDPANNSTNGYQPLHVAAFHGHTKLVKFLVSSGADVNASCNKPGDTVVKEVVYGGCSRDRLETLKFLLDSGAKADVADDNGYTPLSYAAFYKDAPAIRMLLAAGAKPDGKSMRNAAEQGSIETLKILLEAGGMADLRDALGNTLLHMSVNRNGSDRSEMVRFLLGQGTDPNAVNTAGETPLHKAAGSCQVESLKLLLAAAKVDIHAVDKQGQTPLHSVAAGSSIPMCWSWMGEEGSLEDHIEALKLVEAAQRLEIARLLIASGISPKTPDKKGRLPSLVAKEAGHAALAQYLETGVRPEAKDPTPAFLKSVRHGTTNDTQALIALGAKVDAADVDGRQAIHVAALSRSSGEAQLLIDAKAKVDAQDKEGVQPIHLAARQLERWHPGYAVSFWLTHGAKADAADKQGRQPLHWLITGTLESRAKERGFSDSGIIHTELEIAKILVKAGADPAAADKAGETPLDMARKTGRKDLAEYFAQAAVERKKR